MHINTIHRRVAQTFLNYVHFRFTDRGSIMSQCCILYKTNYVPWINKKTHKKKTLYALGLSPPSLLDSQLDSSKSIVSHTVYNGQSTVQFASHSPIHTHTLNHWWQRWQAAVACPRTADIWTGDARDRTTNPLFSGWPALPYHTVHTAPWCVKSVEFSCD